MVTAVGEGSKARQESVTSTGTTINQTTEEVSTEDNQLLRRQPSLLEQPGTPQGYKVKFLSGGTSDWRPATPC